MLSDGKPGERLTIADGNKQGEIDQANYAEKMYTLLFSHASVDAIAWWNFVDNDWDTIPSGMIRRDLTPKPVYFRLLELIKKRWNTNIVSTSDKDGEIPFRGFLGTYKISVSSNGTTCSTTMNLRRGTNGFNVIVVH